MGAVSRPCVKPPTGTGSAFSLADLSVPCDRHLLVLDDRDAAHRAAKRRTHPSGLQPRQSTRSTLGSDHVNTFRDFGHGGWEDAEVCLCTSATFMRSVLMSGSEPSSDICANP
jgi:hypothetical protein